MLLCALLSLLPCAILAVGPCVRVKRNASGSTDGGISRIHVLIFEAESNRTRLHAFTFEFKSGGCPFNLTLTSAKTASFPVIIARHASYPELLRRVMIPLMDFAKFTVPKDARSRSLAVMRYEMRAIQTVSGAQRRGVVRVMADLMRRHGFLVPTVDADAVGLVCVTDAAILRWVAVNFLTGAFHLGSASDGVLDLDNDWAQILYVPGSYQPVVDFESPDIVAFTWPCETEHALRIRAKSGLGLIKAKHNILGYNRTFGSSAVFESTCLSPLFNGTVNSTRVFGTGGVAGVDRASSCSSNVAAAIAYDVSESVASNNFVAVGGFYRVARLLRRLNFLDTAIPGHVTVGALANATRRVCASPPTSGEEHEPYICMDATHILMLLRRSFRFGDARQILVVERIGDSGAEANWMLGYAIQQIICDEFFNFLEKSANRGAQPNGSLALTLAQALSYYFLPLLIHHHLN